MNAAQKKRIYNSRAWKTIRAETIRRANRRCQLQLPGCSGLATQGDHVIALEDGGDPLNFNNVQASCRSCNVAKENYRRQGLLLPTQTGLNPGEKRHANWSRQWWPCSCPGCAHRHTHAPTA